MKKVLLILACCMCLCGCGNKEEEFKRTECINQSKGEVTIWTLFHDSNKIYKIKRESKKYYNTLSELKEAEQSTNEHYNFMKQNYEEQGNNVSINIAKSDHSLIQQIAYDCKENGFFANVGCNYQDELNEFENDLISYTCIERE